MNVIDKFLVNRYAQNDPIVVPQDVTEQQVETIKPETQVQTTPFDVDVPKKRPHTVVPEEFIPENILAVPQLANQMIPLAESILEKWQRKEEIENDIKNKKKELNKAIKALKEQRGYDLLLKELEEDSERLGEAIESIDTESDVVLRRFKSWFVAVARKLEQSQQALLTDKDKVDYILGWVKDFDSNLSRSVVMKLRWLEKKTTIVTERVKRFVRLFPIPETERTKKRSMKLVAQVEDGLGELLDSTYEDAIKVLSGLHELEGDIESAINEVNSL